MEKRNDQKKYSLVTKIVFPVVLIIFFFGALAVILVSRFTHSQLLQEKQVQLLKSTQEQAHETSIVLSKSHAVAIQISKLPLIADYISQKNPKIQDKKILSLLSDFNVGDSFSAIYLLDRNGNTLVSTEPKLIGQNYVFRDYFIEAMNGQKGSDVALGLMTNELGYFLSAPVIVKGEILGVMVVKMRSKMLSDELLQNEKDVIANTGFKKYMVDKYGVIIFSDGNDRLFSSLGDFSSNLLDSEVMLKRYGRPTVNTLQYQTEMDAVLQRKEQMQRNFLDEDDEMEEVITTVKVRDYPLYVVTEMDVNELANSVNKIVRLLGLTVASAVLAATFVIILLITRWLRPLKKIRQVATEISLGDFNQRITDLPNDELGDLAESFNKMTESLVKAKRNVEEQVEIRTIELTKLNQFLVGRELKMADLKKQLRDAADEKK